MKGIFVAAAVALLGLMPSNADAQQVCAYEARVAPQGRMTISGFVCSSREAAIGAAFHYQFPDEKARAWLGLRRRPNHSDIVQFVNEFREEPNACAYLTREQPLIVKKMNSKVHHDGDGRGNAMNVTYWEAKFDHATITVVTAHYLDGC